MSCIYKDKKGKATMSKYTVICSCGDHIDLVQDEFIPQRYKGRCLGCGELLFLFIMPMEDVDGKPTIPEYIQP